MSYFEQNSPPVEDGPTPVQWAEIRAAAEKGDDVRCFDACVDAGIDPRMGKVYQVALGEDRRLDKVVLAGAGQEKVVRQCEQRLAVLNRVQPASTEEADRLLEQVQSTKAELAEAHGKVEAARIAAIQRAGLRQVFQGLFAVERRIPVRDMLSEPVRSELRKLGLPTETADPHLWLSPLPLPPKAARHVKSPLMK